MRHGWSISWPGAVTVIPAVFFMPPATMAMVFLPVGVNEEAFRPAACVSASRSAGRIVPGSGCRLFANTILFLVLSGSFGAVPAFICQKPQPVFPSYSPYVPGRSGTTISCFQPIQKPKVRHFVICRTFSAVTAAMYLRKFVTALQTSLFLYRSCEPGNRPYGRHMLRYSLGLTPSTFLKMREK